MCLPSSGLRLFTGHIEMSTRDGPGHMSTLHVFASITHPNFTWEGPLAKPYINWQMRSWAWQYLPVIPTLLRLIEKHQKFETSLHYTVRLALKQITHPNTYQVRIPCRTLRSRVSLSSHMIRSWG